MSQHLEGKNLIELLDMLEPVPNPPAISLLPQTPGWIVVGAVVLGLVIWAIIRVRAHRRANAYRRAAMAELAEIGDDAAGIATLLRRTALAGFQRHEVAGLTGRDWLAFLDQSYGGTGFSGDQGRLLLSAPYRKNTADPALAQLAQVWISSHRRAAR